MNKTPVLPTNSTRPDLTIYRKIPSTMAMSKFPVSFKIERYYDKYYEKAYNLSASDPESLTLKEMLAMADEECTYLWENMKFSYTDMAGHPKIREEVAMLHNMKPENVLEIIPIEGIYLAMNCLVRYLKSKYNISKIHAVTTFPAYQSLQENLKLLECEVTNWTMKKTDSGWHLDLVDLTSQLKKNTKILVVNFPHNPTGTMLNQADWRKLIDVCKEKDIFLFSDEMYRFLNLDGAEPLPSACELYENSITLFGLSKSFALPGLRLGWLCTQNTEVQDMIQRFKDYTSVCGTLPSEILGIIALRNRKQITGRIIDTCNKNLNLLDEFFKEYPDIFEWLRPKACTTGFLKLKGWLLKIGTGGASGFCEALAREKDVVLLPGSVYDYDDEYVRLGFGRTNVPEALAKVKDFLDNYKH